LRFHQKCVFNRKTIKKEQKHSILTVFLFFRINLNLEKTSKNTQFHLKNEKNRVKLMIFDEKPSFREKPRKKRIPTIFLGFSRFLDFFQNFYEISKKRKLFKN
jgi:hypothetical protein